MFAIPNILLTLLFFVSSVLHCINGIGEKGILIYSTDDECQGQELVRAFTSHCQGYYSADGSLNYFKFTCNERYGFIGMDTYSDRLCESLVNSTIILNNHGTSKGSCERYHSATGMGYESIQLICGEVSNSDIKSKYKRAFSNSKVSLSHYPNTDSACAEYPSVIELWDQDKCLYYPSLDYTHFTGVYARFDEEITEKENGRLGLISAQYFKNQNCRLNNGGEYTPPENDDALGQPERKLLLRQDNRLLQGGHEGDPNQGGQEGQQPPDENHDDVPSITDDHASIDADIYECVAATNKILGVTLLDTAVATNTRVSSLAVIEFEEDNSVSAESDSSLNKYAVSTWTLSGLVILVVAGLVYYLNSGGSIYFARDKKSEIKIVDLDPNSQHNLLSDDLNSIDHLYVN